MKKKASQTVAAMVGMIFLLAGCGGSGIQEISSGIAAGTDIVKAATLTDDEIKEKALQAVQQLDTSNKIAPASDKYAKRLEKLVSKHKKEDELNLNYKVYLTPDINAFALADGSIRVYSGLMDMMTNNELLFIIGHETGHVKLGHHKKALQMAYSASAARKGAAVAGSEAAVISSSALGDFAEKLINAQFSQSEEKDADDYGLKFLQKNNYEANAAVTALEKLAGLGGKHGILSSHPDPEKRAKRLASEL